MTAMMLLIVLYQILYSQKHISYISEPSSLEAEHDKITNRIKPLIERDNEELRKANQVWYEKYEDLSTQNSELSAKNSELIYEVRKMYCMLNTIIMIISTVLVSYTVVVYCHILAAV